VLDHPDTVAEMGARGREWVIGAASPAAVGAAYDTLIRSLARHP